MCVALCVDLFPTSICFAGTGQTLRHYPPFHCRDSAKQMREAEKQDSKRQKIEQKVEDKKIMSQVAAVAKAQGPEAAKAKARELMPGKAAVPRLQDVEPPLTHEDLGPLPDPHVGDRPWQGDKSKAQKPPKKGGDRQTTLTQMQHTTKDSIVLGEVDVEEQRAIERSIKERGGDTGRAHSLSGSGAMPSGSGSGGPGAPAKPKKRSAGLSKPAADKGRQELQKSMESSDDDE